MDRPARQMRLLPVSDGTLVGLVSLLASCGYDSPRVLMGSLVPLTEMVACWHRDTSSPLVVVFAARTESSHFHRSIFPHADDVYFTTPVLKGSEGTRLFTGTCVAVFDVDMTRRSVLASKATHATLVSAYDAKR